MHEERSAAGDGPWAFGPESELWRVNRYATGLLFGPGAVLLQIAHPRVAQGVLEHSDFEGDSLGRLRRTLTTVNTIAFGTEEQAQAMAAHMRAIHGRVRGHTDAGIPGNPRYSAFEPELMLWVLGTLIEASLKGYALAWGDLSLERKQRFYRDFRRFGTYFGLREDWGPGSYPAFAEYYQGVLQSDWLGAHPACARVAGAVVHPRSSALTRILGCASDFLAIESIPANLRDRLGLRSTAGTRLRMRLLRLAAPAAFRFLPRRLTYYPEAYRAERTLLGAAKKG